MAGPRHDINALIQVRPDEARARILDALEKARMHRGDASELLGCSHGTLLRWIAELGLQPRIDAMAAKARAEGWHHDKNRQSPGRPVGAKDRTPRTRRAKSLGVNSS